MSLGFVSEAGWVFSAAPWAEGQACLEQALPFLPSVELQSALNAKMALGQVWFFSSEVFWPVFLSSYWNSQSWAVEIWGYVLHNQCLEAGWYAELWGGGPC